MTYIHPLLEPVLRRDRARVLAGLGLVAVAAWAYTVYLSWSMAAMDYAAMPPLHAQTWTVGDTFATFLMWAVMMAAMMLPASAPMIAMVATINRSRRARAEPFTPTTLFVAGYLVVWSAFGALATFMQWALRTFALLTPMMESAHPVFTGILLIAAGVYQWAPLKAACLNHCRSPMGFLMMEWREGRLGALVMGARHGLFCVGCCWVLMILLFAVSVMNLMWVAALTALVLIERALPRADLVRHLAGGGMLMAGGIILARAWL
jgi:predicted metal-binding membrane protein